MGAPQGQAGTRVSALSSSKPPRHEHAPIQGARGDRGSIRSVVVLCAQGTRFERNVRRVRQLRVPQWLPSAHQPVAQDEHLVSHQMAINLGEKAIFCCLGWRAGRLTAALFPTPNVIDPRGIPDDQSRTICAGSGVTGHGRKALRFGRESYVMPG
jgi:hypothetical protein